MLSRRAQEISPYLILSFGVALFVIAVVHHVTEVSAVDRLVGPAVALAVDGPPALGLAYAGYRLTGTGLSPEERWQVSAWCLVGAVLFVTIMSLSILVRAFEGRVIGEALFPLLLATEAGGIAGVAAGHQTARARIQARRAQTASETLRERTQQLQGVLDSVEAAIWIRDTDSQFVLANQEVRTLLGIDQETEIAGKPLEEVVPPGVADQFRKNDQRVLETEQPVEVEEPIETERGTREFLTRITPLLEGEDLNATCGVATEITEQKEYERTIEQQNDRLEQFASVVSHDLRNPLNVASARLGLAEKECDSEHLEHTDRALGRMEALIEDLLALARGDETTTDPDPVDLETVAADCWANVETTDATLVTDVDRALIADESRLKQVFENLFRNAIQHGRDDATVTIGARANKFYVEDDGPGIPEGERENVLDAGYSTDDEGTGLGLSIVKQVADVHGWEVGITESATGGVRFEFTGVDITDE
jgi:PAS domain S-box-containing protein